LQEMTRAGLVGTGGVRPGLGGSSSSSAAARAAANATPQTVRAECSQCKKQNEFTLPYSPTPVTVRCGHCSNTFPVQMPPPPVMDIRLCRGCGQMNQYPLPQLGQPFPSVQCPMCGSVSQRRGLVQQSDKRRAVVLSEAQDGPMVVVSVGGRRRPVPLMYLMALMAEEGQSNAAPSADIQALPVHKVDDDTNLGNQTCCTICIEDFKDGDELKTLPCLHIYHHNCIDSWLQRDNSCPCCKSPIGDQARASASASSAGRSKQQT